MALKQLILAMVSGAPSTGYDITKEFDLVAGYFWKASHQQVYRELAALTEEGLVRFRAVAQQGKPDKKLYAITAKGKKAFAEWFSSPLDPPRQGDPLMIKFFAGEIGGIDELLDQLAQARTRHAETLAAYEAIAAEHYSGAVETMPRWQQLIYLTLRWGITRERAWLRWADESARVLEN